MNLKSKMSYLVSILFILLGIILNLCDAFLWKTDVKVWLSIGSSLIASGIVAFLTQLLLSDMNKSQIDEWKIIKIFERRIEKNIETDQKLPFIKDCIDGIAFGLRTWRKNETEILNALNRGVNIRLITMDPSSPHVKERSEEENQNEDIKASINNLIDFCKKMNNSSLNGKIELKGYRNMTLDLYWRMDDYLYVGPYLLHKPSSDTITYNFIKGGKGFSYYTKYFNEVWNSPELINLLN